MKRIFFLVGFCAVLSQILILRELLGTFYGNELVISALLAGWLILTGAGSFFSGRLLESQRVAGILLIALVALTGVLLPGEIALIRALRLILLDHPGEAASFTLIFFSSILCLFPLCFSLGALFTVGCRMFSLPGSSEEPSAIYMLEGAGALFGGIVFSYLLYRLEPFTAALCVSLLSLTASLSICSFLDRGRFRLILGLVLAVLLVFLLAFSLSPAREQFDWYLKSLKFPGERLLLSRNHRYGNFAVTSTKDQFNFYQNGLAAGTNQGRLYAEELVHIPLLQVREPHSILMIGGGLEGMIREALKHGPSAVHYAELDPLAIPIGMDYLDPEERKSLEDLRVTLHLESDGRRVVRAHKNTFDALFLSVGPPANALVNRFFTSEFFREVKGALNPGGIFAFPLTAAQGYIGPEHGELLRSIRRTLGEVFPSVKVLKEDYCGILFLASASEDSLSLDIAASRKRHRDRGLRNSWVLEENLTLFLDPNREEPLREVFARGKGYLNRDLWPLGYFLFLDYWQARFAGVGKKTFSTLLRTGFWELAILLFAGIGMIILIERKPERKLSISVPATLFASGFTGLAFENYLVFSFQAFYGYLYHFLGLIIATFMFGLVLGSWSMKGRITSSRKAGLLLIGLQALLALFCLVSPFAFRLLAEGERTPMAASLFPLLNLFVGFAVGAEFPLANRVCRALNRDPVKIAGTLYGADLFGASLGALATGMFLIPLFGIAGGLRVTALLNVLTIFLLAWGMRQGRSRVS